MSSADTEAADVEDVPDEPAVDDAREALLARVRTGLGDAVVGSHILAGHALWVRVTRDAWTEAATFARHDLGFDFFDFLSAIDWLPSPFGRDMEAEQDWVVHGRETKETPAQETGHAGGDTRFQLLGRVQKAGDPLGLILKADLPDDDLRAPTWIPEYPGADWHEREAWEMFGIHFDGHPGLRHIYLPGEFEGNPLRKDYPLLARRVKPWPGIVDVELMPGDEGP